MYRVIKAATEETDYEDYLEDLGLDYDASDIANAVDRFNEVQQEADDNDQDLAGLIEDYSFDGDYDPETGAQITAICNHLRIEPSDITQFRENSDSDFCAVTLKNGTVKYFFDRGVFDQGIKDAETGKLIQL